jgi:hypothetical protein
LILIHLDKTRYVVTDARLLAHGVAQAQVTTGFRRLRVSLIGEISWQNLIARFGIQVAATTRNIAQYKKLAPHSTEYEAVRTPIPASFVLGRGWTPSRRAMSHRNWSIERAEA